MKESPKINARPFKFNTGDEENEKMLLGKQLSEWLSRTSKLSSNMGQAYNVILRKSTTFIRAKLESLKGWDSMSESSDLIALMKGIKGLILWHDDTEYFYMGMRSSLRGFLNLHQGGVTVTEYLKR